MQDEHYSIISSNWKQKHQNSQRRTKTPRGKHELWNKFHESPQRNTGAKSEIQKEREAHSACSLKWETRESIAFWIFVSISPATSMASSLGASLSCNSSAILLFCDSHRFSVPRKKLWALKVCKDFPRMTLLDRKKKRGGRDFCYGVGARTDWSSREILISISAVRLFEIRSLCEPSTLWSHVIFSYGNGTIAVKLDRFVRFGRVWNNWCNLQHEHSWYKLVLIPKIIIIFAMITKSWLLLKISTLIMDLVANEYANF